MFTFDNMKTFILSKKSYQRKNRHTAPDGPKNVPKLEAYFGGNKDHLIPTVCVSIFETKKSQGNL